LLKLAELARDDTPAREYLTRGNIDPQAWKYLPDESLFKHGFQSYLDEYGHRATYEIDCSKPRWREDPGYLLKNIAKTIDSADSVAHKQRQQQAYDDAQKQLNQKLGFFKRNWVMSLIKQAVKGAETREKAKSYTVKLSDLTRQIFMEAGRRLYRRGLISDVNDVFFCSQADVYAVLMGLWNGDALPLLIAERQQALTTMAMEKAPDVIINNERRYEQAVPFGDGNQYKGIGVSAGVAQGRAQIIHTPDEGERLSPGDIMVAPSTDPSWTPLFIHAAGIVLETGGYTSHGSIVAREYGIPAVVNIAGALRLIKNGQTIRVNANNGTVTLS
jgi:pyruvate,water dikinase